MSNIKQLLPIEYVRDIEYQKVIISKIPKAKVSSALDYFKNVQIYQNDKLEHLKRINKDPGDENFLNLLICFEEDREKLDMNKLNELGINDLSVFKVSKFPPYTKEQYEKFKIPWPITFKKKAMDIIDFTQKEKEIIDINIKRAIELAKQSYESGNKFNACILVDPNKKNKILKESLDNTQRHIASVNHCIIEMAKSFGEYCKSLNKSTIKIKKNRNESVFEECKATDLQEQKQEDNEEDKEEEDKGEQEIPKASSLKRKAKEDLESYYAEDYYYCLGLDIYMVVEPCVMCAMALVHSRVARVFYSIPYEGPGQGGLNEKIQLNNLEGLNHRYKVFYNVLSDEATAINKALTLKE